MKKLFRPFTKWMIFLVILLSVSIYTAVYHSDTLPGELAIEVAGGAILAMLIFIFFRKRINKM